MTITPFPRHPGARANGGVENRPPAEVCRADNIPTRGFGITKLKLAHPIGEIREVDVRTPTTRDFRRARNRRPAEARYIMDLHTITGLSVATVRAMHLTDAQAIDLEYTRLRDALAAAETCE